MTSTHLNATAVRAAAGNLGRIMDDISAFTALRQAWPSLGNFDLATQLQAIIDDRRTGVLVHADELKESLGDLSNTLMKIATDIASTDNGAAEKIRGLVADLTVRVNSECGGSEASLP